MNEIEECIYTALFFNLLNFSTILMCFIYSVLNYLDSWPVILAMSLLLLISVWYNLKQTLDLLNRKNMDWTKYPMDGVNNE